MYLIKGQGDFGVKVPVFFFFFEKVSVNDGSSLYFRSLNREQGFHPFASTHFKNILDSQLISLRQIKDRVGISDCVELASNRRGEDRRTKPGRRFHFGRNLLSHCSIGLV